MATAAGGLCCFGSLVHAGFEVDGVLRLRKQLVMACLAIVFGKLCVGRVVERDVTVLCVKNDFVGSLLRHKKVKRKGGGEGEQN